MAGRQGRPDGRRCRGLIDLSQSEPPLSKGRVADRAAKGIRVSRYEMGEPIPNTSQAPMDSRSLALFCQ